MTPRHRRPALLAAVAAASLFLVTTQGAAQRSVGVTTPPFAGLKFRHIGPVGNRVSAVAGVPGDPRVYYAGAASGGIFKSTDGGANWFPIFDDQVVSSIGSLAVTPGDPTTVWAGTGEAFIRGNISIGNGIYKSTDAGRTWTHMGLENTGRIGRIAIDPRNPDVVFAAALGHAYGPQQDRGVYRTKDGGKTWERVLFVDENTGCADVVMDPNNPRVLFAGMWQLVIRTWGRESGGPGSGIYVSRDGGTTWVRLVGHGLPDPPMGKIGLAVAPTDSNRVYALIETNDGGVWRSDDGGRNWRLMNQDHELSQRWHYYTRLAVAPDDQNEVYFVASRMSISTDGGATIERMGGGGDNHDMWIDPTDPTRMILGHDGGVVVSINRGQGWLRPSLPIAQMYHAYTDNAIPYNVYGNMQDGPSFRGPSHSRLPNGTIPAGAWQTLAGCESGFAMPDPVDSNIVWSGCYEGRLDRYDARTGQARAVGVQPDSMLGWAPADMKYRFQWTTPFMISPHDHNTVYIGSQFLHKTTDAGQSWTTVSPDLTSNDKTKQGVSGGLSPDMFSVETAPVIFAVAESPLQKGLLWVGTNDGYVHVTRDGGVRWTNVTANLPGLPPWGTVSNIEPSKYDVATCYLTVDLHQVNNRDPFVYKTTDYGKTWTQISGDIPKSVFSYAHCVREDPVRKGLLYVGTENGLYVSFNDGTNWVPLQGSLPHAPVHWLTIQPLFNDLVVATYGRGFWILDDLSALQGLTSEVVEADAHLFVPRGAYRFRYVHELGNRTATLSTGRNPEGDAVINYYLKAEQTAGATITIRDEQGQVVRTLRGSGTRGLNRAWWDLRYDTPAIPRLRTLVPGHPHVALGPQGWRPFLAWQNTHPRAWGGERGVLVPLGRYTVELAAGTRVLKQSIVVKKDPNSQGTEADARAQAKVVLELKDEIAGLVAMIDAAEVIRKQLIDVVALLEAEAANRPLAARSREVEKKALALEGQFFQIESTGYQDGVRTPRRLYEKMLQLIFDVGLDGADFPPTSQQLETHRMYQQQLTDYRRRLDDLLTTDVAALNAALHSAGVGTIVIGKRGITD